MAREGKMGRRGEQRVNQAEIPGCFRRLEESKRREREMSREGDDKQTVIQSDSLKR